MTLLPSAEMTRSFRRGSGSRSCSRRPASWARRWRGCCVPSRHAQGASGRALLRNAGGPRGWQSVVKRIAGGSARTPQELKRLLDYVAREEGVQSTWCNLAGYERDFDPARTERTADIWSSTWTGAPRRGHADHIVLSFPRGVDAERAESSPGNGGRLSSGPVSMGMSGAMSALHKDTDHLHAHFVVDKHGIEEGRFLSICRHAALNFDVMRELHAEISQSHGLNILASSRLSRGIIENPPRQSDLRASREGGKVTPPPPPPLSDGSGADGLPRCRASPANTTPWATSPVLPL